MKIDDRYEIRMAVVQLVAVDYSSFKYLGNVYTDLEEFKRDNPDSECKLGVDYKVGFIIFDTYCGCVPDNCNNWYGNIDELIVDYNNCL